MNESGRRDAQVTAVISPNCRELSAFDVKNIYIKEQQNRWLAKAEVLPHDSQYVEKVANMFIRGGRTRGPSLIVPDSHGGHRYIPIDYGYQEDSTLPKNLKADLLKLRSFHQDPANKTLLKEVDRLLEDEVKNKCFSTSMDIEKASLLSFFEKVEIVAENRLAGRHADIPYFHCRMDSKPDLYIFALDVTHGGEVECRRLAFRWYESGDNILAILNQHLPASTARNLQQLAIISGMSPWSASTKEEMRYLLGEKQLEGDSDFVYAFIRPRPAPGALSTFIRDMRPLDLGELKNFCKKTGHWAIVMRPWKMRLHTAWTIFHDKMQKEYLRLPLVEIFDEDNQVNATNNGKTDAERMEEAGWIERLSDV